MAVLDILHVPDPRLKAKATPVERFDAKLRRLADDMLETMYRAPGIGLAAPQVGVPKRLFVVDVGPAEKREPLVLANPDIVWLDEDQILAEEGCLSLPDQFAEVGRARAVRVTYQDGHGQPHELEAEGLFARCLQHEYDHLDGVLFTDHLTALKRNMILRRLAKAKRLRA